MKRRFRLANSTEFMRVRRLGRSYAHPLFVLIVLPNELPVTRIGVAASRSVGGAVARNRAKRRLRAAIAARLGSLHAGWDIVLVARKPLLESKFDALQFNVESLLKRAEILEV